jgi:transcription termination/antitermination protein NusA
MNKELVAVFEYLEREKGIKREIVISAIEESLLMAARKSIHGATNVTVQIHPKSGNIEVYCDKEIVDKVKNPVTEVSYKDYSALDPDCEVGQIVTMSVTPKDFGRIAAQKARQIISQKLRGAERDVIYEEYRHRINQLISGTVKRVAGGTTVIVDLGKVEGVLPRRNFPPTESYQVGDKVLALLQEVRDTDTGGAEVVLSRSHPDFVKLLLVQEVPELADGTISIEKIVREPGYRTKLIVRSSDMKVDPVGACIGMRGVRVKNIVRELNNEKIDVIPYASDKLQLLQQALQPVQIRKIRVNDDESQIFIVVEDEEFGAAIGKKGLNVRLIGELLDIHLEIQKMSDFHRVDALERAALAQLDDPSLDEGLASMDGISNLVIDQLIAEGYTTQRKVLEASLEKLAEIPGISLDMADKILEQIRKTRT